MARPGKHCILMIPLLLILLLMAAGTGRTEDVRRVLIDPAHGGEDLGVVSDRIREKDLTLKLALLLRREAQKTKRVRVELIRTADVTLTTAERIKAVERMKPDCLIVLHINAGFGRKASGYELYFPGFRKAVGTGTGAAPILKDMAQNRYLNDAVRLGQKMQARLDSLFPRKGRGLRDGPNALLDGLTVPGIIVEMGFATNTADRRALTDEKVQQAAAGALFKGIQDYFQP